MKGSASRGVLSPEMRAAVVRHILQYRLYRQPRVVARFLSIVGTSGKGSIPEKARRTARDVIYCLCESHYRGLPASVSDVFLAAEVAKTTAIRCINLLEKLDVVIRASDPSDRRRAAITLTPAYQELLEAFIGEVFDDFEDVIDVGRAAERRRAEERAAADRVRLQEAIEAITDGLALFDADDRLVLCNSKYHEALGVIGDRLKPGVAFREIVETLLDANFYVDVKPGDRKPYLAKRLESHRRCDGAILQHLAGERWVEVMEYRTADGGTLLIRRDVTEQRRADFHMRRLVGAVDSAAELFTLCDAQDRIIFCNEKVRDLNRAVAETLVVGVPFENHVRAAVAKGLVPDAKGREKEWIEERLARHRNPGEPFEVQRQDGIWLLVHEQRLPDGGVATIATDITKLKKTEAAWRDAKEQAEYANRSKTVFLANLSHEFRTPLNSIIGFSEILKEEPFGSLGSPRRQEYARDISDSARHLLDLINDIIDLSRVEASGELPLREQIVDVGAMVDSCRRLVDGLAEGAGLKLKVEALASMPGLYADERRVRQILLNLLGNAIRYTPKGGTVTLSASTQTDNAMVFRVADNGPGIPSENIGAMLTPLSATTKRWVHRPEGSGFGLAIAKSLAEMHGATMRLESTPGTGTIVTVRFPKERVVPCAH